MSLQKGRGCTREDVRKAAQEPACARLALAASQGAVHAIQPNPPAHTPQTVRAARAGTTHFRTTSMHCSQNRPGDGNTGSRPQSRSGCGQLVDHSTLLVRATVPAGRTARRTGPRAAAA